MDALFRWIARFTSIVVVVMVLLFLIAEGVDFRQLTLVEALKMLLFLAACLGMMLAWRLERTGAIVSLVSLVLFITLVWVDSGHPPHEWVFGLMILPGLFFLLSAHHTPPVQPT